MTVSVASSQVSTVQSTPSSVAGATPAWQSAAASQLSEPLQNRPSSQAASEATAVHSALASSHASVVQSMPSSHSIAVPAAQPVAVSQVSMPLQNMPSSQAESVGV